MKILNLYAGIGGNRFLWNDEHEITAVEINSDVVEIYKNYFPNDNVIIGDAHQYLIENSDDFDMIWSSPPCPTHSRMMKGTRHKIRKYPDMKLYQEIIFLQHFYQGKWVVENVMPYYTPLIEQNLKVDRHLFWCDSHTELNFKKPSIQNKKDFIMTATIEGRKSLFKWLDIPIHDKIVYYEGSHDPCSILRKAVHPKIGKAIMDSWNVV